MDSLSQEQVLENIRKSAEKYNYEHSKEYMQKLTKSYILVTIGFLVIGYFAYTKLKKSR